MEYVNTLQKTKCKLRHLLVHSACSKFVVFPWGLVPSSGAPSGAKAPPACTTKSTHYTTNPIPSITDSRNPWLRPCLPCWKSLTSKPPAENLCHGLVRNISNNKSQIWCCTGQGTWYLVQPLCCRADEPQGRGRAKETEMRPYAFESLTQS